MVGSGGLVVMDNNTCMIEVARFFMNFTQKESCGKCVPCREGTKRMLEIIERIVSGAGEEGDVELLLELSETITETSLCGLGKSAAFPVLSTIKNFPEEYDVHIKEKRCPTGTCQQLKQFVVDAISGKVKEPFVIDNVKCIKCAACVDVCPFKAIKEVF
jgi:NADH-quinone oxidoreductase subunit F